MKISLRLHPGLVYGLVLSFLVLLFFFLALGSLVIGEKALTYDEPQHFRYGELILQGQADRFIDSTMPVSALNVVAARVASDLFGKYLDNPWQSMSVGRASTAVFSVLVGFVCLLWARSLYGRLAGVVALGLYVLEPNIIAHSGLITTDIFAAGTITLSLFLFWRFLQKPNLCRGTLSAFALGLAQIAKYTSISLYPILALLGAIRYGPSIVRIVRQADYRKVGRPALVGLGYSALFVIIPILVINAAFLFRGTGTPLGDYEFQSRELRSLTPTFPSARKVPIPLPYSYLHGLDLVVDHERTGVGHGPNYLLGELREGQGFPGYFLVASLLKVPLPILFLLAASVIEWLKGPRGDRLWQEELYLLVPAVVLGLYFNLMFRAQIGLRFFLVVFPVLLIFSARFFRNWKARPRWVKGLSIVGGAYLVLSVASYFPHYLSYFNELVFDRKLAYRYLADSNLDWGQDRAVLSEFLEAHPEYVFEPETPTTGRIIVGVNELTGVLGDPQTFAWLRENFRPIDHLNYSYLIFDISSVDLDRIGGAGFN